MAFDVGTATAFLNLDISNFVGGLLLANREVSGLGTGLSSTLVSTGMQMSAVGSVMTNTFTKPIIDGFVSVVSAAGDLEESLTNVKKTTDGSEAEYQALVEWAQNLSTEIPVAANELLDIGEIIGQMGVDIAGNVSGFEKYIEVAAKLAYTTDMTAESAANFIGRFSTLMGVTEADADALGATIVDLGNKYNGTESQIAALALRLTGAASVVDMSAAGVLGLAGAMVNVGLTAETGGSSMSRFIENIDEATYEGGQKLEAFAKLAGVSADVFVKAWRENPEAAILNLIENMSKMQAQGGNVYATLDTLDIGTIRYKDTILRLLAATEKSNKAMDDSNKAWADATALEIEAAKRKEDFNAQLTMTKNAWEEIKVALGEAFLPVLKDLLGKLRDWFDTIKDKINPESVLMVAKIVAIVAAIGPLLTILGTLIVVVGLIATPVGLVVTAIVAVIAIIVLWGDEIMKFINGALAWYRQAVVDAVNWVEGAWRDTLQWFRDAWNNISTWWQGLLNDIGNFFTNKWNDVTEFFSTIWGNILNWFRTAWGNISTWFNDTIGNIVSSVAGFGTRMWEVGKGLFTDLFDGIKSVWEKLKQWVSSSWDWLVDKLDIFGWFDKKESSANSHSAGLDYVPYDNYYARLHKGERVLTAQENKGMASSGGSKGNTFIFNSPKALDPVSMQRQFESAQRRQSLLLDLG